MKKFAFTMMAAGLLTVSASGTVMAAGFVKTAQGTKYDWGGGNYCVNNWVHVKDHWYYFGNDALMRTGWIQRDDTWYFATDTGELQAGIMKINDNVYKFDRNSCKLITGYDDYNGKTYYFTENGVKGGTYYDPYVYTQWNSNGSLKRGFKNSPQ